MLSLENTTVSVVSLTLMQAEGLNGYLIRDAFVVGNSVELQGRICNFTF
jgi:hypothetical protein